MGCALVAMAEVDAPPAGAEAAGAPAFAPAARAAAPSGGFALRGTIVFTDARYSEALVDLGAGDLRRVGVGSSLGRWGEVTAIERDGIVFRRDGVDYEVTFNDSSPSGMSGAALAGAPEGIGVDAPVVDDASEQQLERRRLQRALRAREILQARRRGESPDIEEQPEQIEETDSRTDIVRDANGKLRAVRHTHSSDE